MIFSSRSGILRMSGTFWKELDYLLERGYFLSKGGTRMVKDIP